jgi:hypothetical protein
MLFRIIALLAVLPTFAFAQIEDEPAGSGLNGVQFLCARNDGAATSMTTANADWGGCVVDEKGRILTVNMDSATGLGQSAIPLSNSTGLAGPPVGLVGWQTVGTDAVEAASTTTVLNLTAHAAKVGDAIRYRTAGANQGAWSTVEAVTTNTVTLSHALPVTPTATDNVTIMTPRPVAAFGNVANNADGFSLGVVYSIDNQVTSNAAFLLKAEDEAAGSGAAGVASFFKVLATPVAQAGDSDYTLPLANAVSVLYTDPSHGIILGTATAEMAAAAITTSYANLLVNTAKLRRCIFVNGTDVAVSFDDTTNPIIERLPAGQIFVDEYGANGRWLATTIRVKEVTNATTGQVGVNCYS